MCTGVIYSRWTVMGNCRGAKPGGANQFTSSLASHHSNATHTATEKICTAHCSGVCVCVWQDTMSHNTSTEREMTVYNVCYVFPSTFSVDLYNYIPLWSDKCPSQNVSQNVHVMLRQCYFGRTVLLSYHILVITSCSITQSLPANHLTPHYMFHVHSISNVV